jgi:hypothetical protein
VSHAPQLPDPPVMSDRDVIEAHALHRRHVLAAFLWGRDRAARSAHTEAVRSLLAGVGIALLVAVLVGVVAVVDASRHRQPHAALTRPPGAEAQTAPMSPQAAASTAAS